MMPVAAQLALSLGAAAMAVAAQGPHLARAWAIRPEGVTLPKPYALGATAPMETASTRASQNSRGKIRLTCIGSCGPSGPELAGRTSWQKQRLSSPIFDMANTASFYGQQPRKAEAVKDLRLAAIGERVYFAGMPPRAMCHGAFGQRGMPMMGMMGMMGRTPMMA